MASIEEVTAVLGSFHLHDLKICEAALGQLSLHGGQIVQIASSAF